MHRPVVIILCTLVTRLAAYYEAKDLHYSVDKLVDRSLRGREQADLDHTTFGKTAHLATSARVRARQVSPLAPARAHLPRARFSDASVRHVYPRRDHRPKAKPADEVDESADLNPLNPNGAWNPFKKTVTPDVSKVSGSDFKAWPARYRSLLERGLQSITAAEALEMVRDQGAVIVDVRTEKRFKDMSVEGAVSVPLMRPVSGDSMFANTKRLFTAALGVESTEPNADFAPMATERLPQDRPVIVACSMGGKLEMPKASSAESQSEKGNIDQIVPDLFPEKDFPEKVFTDTDRYTTSLKAAYALYEAGFSKLYFLKGGINQWQVDGQPMAPGAAS
eukprot:gnl/TRDRNA2_/TRDRNA2_194110_c0_seq1.p1 gnl/TRDRNA2_/TRDRNA2_194110_c0~~gnl/TRDRNA2_/TRDRNA2_194110_c0_seq1.p1  ORF type:complete len:335 (+),score=36.28 gnl/TRDRNA2_/TRDRNA2_194110_c0_seq1:50-1054(+)